MFNISLILALYCIAVVHECSYLTSVSQQTGILLDPTYSGKALYYFSKYLKNISEAESTSYSSGADSVNKPCLSSTDRICFLHTGGVFSLYEKISSSADGVSSGGEGKFSNEMFVPITAFFS